MLRKTLAILLATILAPMAIASPRVDAQTVKDARLVEKARAKVAKLGVGQDARVEVKLRDNTKLNGYVSAAGEDSFTVTNSKTGTSSTVAYTDVAQVKEKGGGLSTRTKVIIGAAVAAGVAIVLYTVRGAFCDGC